MLKIVGTQKADIIDVITIWMRFKYKQVWWMGYSIECQISQREFKPCHGVIHMLCTSNAWKSSITIVQTCKLEH